MRAPLRDLVARLVVRLGRRPAEPRPPAASRVRRPQQQPDREPPEVRVPEVRVEEPPAEASYLLIVGAAGVARFHQLRRLFREDRTVHVMLDRRRGERRKSPAPWSPERRRDERRRSHDYWQDSRIHPVVLIPLARRAAARTEGGARLEARTENTEGKTMDVTIASESRERVLRWTEESQFILGRTIPALFEDHETLRKRLAEAAEESERLRVENLRLRDELNEAKERHRAAVAGQTEIVESVGKLMNNMTQILEPMRDLADKLHQMPRTTH